MFEIKVVVDTQGRESQGIKETLRMFLERWKEVVGGGTRHCK